MAAFPALWGWAAASLICIIGLWMLFAYNRSFYLFTRRQLSVNEPIQLSRARDDGMEEWVEFCSDTGSPKLAWLLEQLKRQRIPYRVSDRSDAGNAPFVSVPARYAQVADAIWGLQVVVGGTFRTVRWINEHDPIWEE